MYCRLQHVGARIKTGEKWVKINLQGINRMSAFNCVIIRCENTQIVVVMGCFDPKIAQPYVGKVQVYDIETNEW